jgi:hypothetical protein
VLAKWKSSDVDHDVGCVTVLCLYVMLWLNFWLASLGPFRKERPRKTGPMITRVSLTTKSSTATAAAELSASSAELSISKQC